MADLLYSPQVLLVCTSADSWGEGNATGALGHQALLPKPFEPCAACVPRDPLISASCFAGAWMEEIAGPYYTFTDAGAKVRSTGTAPSRAETQPNLEREGRKLGRG